MAAWQTEAHESRAQRLVLRSLHPMLISDYERRYRDASAAACSFLSLPRDEICKLTLDDLPPPKMRAGAAARWTRFLRDRNARRTVVAQARDLLMPDGTTVAVDLSSTPDFRPRRHLGIVAFPAGSALDAGVVQDGARPATC